MFVPQGLGSTYQLFFKATATGQLSGLPVNQSGPVATTGAFTSATFTLMGVAGNSANFGNFNAQGQITPTGLANAVTLATGSLLNDPNNSVSTNAGGSAFASADISFVEPARFDLLRRPRAAGVL